ncbi:hypothetical protein HID58_048119 [Brassica napus]|uniref:Bifunctional inhibitor/plant lipid transfer protein/seed storage helical domain-containing protein n=2 Tax=Brassica napus TaxID=3708 RepID=A0ABQ8B2Q2_BRANA|nr:hypothetical protein HID58_048119 [Brassica napus]
MAPRTSLALFLFLNLLFFTYTSAQGTCPRNALQIGACTNVLNAIDLTLGNTPPPVPPCCSLIAGLADLEAAVCLCTALDVNVLGINVHLPIDISVLFNACSRFAPPSFQCPPLDDFDLIHRDALRDLDNMTLSQRLFVADAHKMIRDERADRVEVGSSDVGGSGSEASSQASRSLRRASREISFDQIDCRPTIYHPGGIFEELGPLPSELLRDPRAQSWGNAIVAHSHLRWPDLSREWIRRQEARIARADWESRLPVVLGPRKSHLSLFTRKQQKILDEARKMDGVPDLSALLKGKLQLLSKKSTTADVQGATSSDAGRASEEGAPGLVDKDVGAEPPASIPKKKKKSKKARRKATEELPLEEIASLDETSEGLEARKGERGRKRPYEGATSSIDRGEVPAVGREGATRGSVESDRSEAAPEDRPRKKKKKKSIGAEPRPSDGEMGLVEVVAGEDVSLETPPEEKEVSARGSDPVTENENLKGVREGETENVGVEDPVLISDSSSEGREDGEEDNDGIEEASLSRPAEEETIYEAGDTDVPPRPVVDSLASIPTRAEDPTAAATKGPDDQDSVL